MHAEKLVPCLSTCQALAKAGIGFEESYFIWESNLHGDWNVFLRNSYKPINPQIPAPTLAELLEWLPSAIKEHALFIGKCGVIPVSGYFKKSFEDPEPLNFIACGNIAESAAKLALWVKQNGYKEASNEQV